MDPATVVIGCAEDLDLARTLHAQGLRVYTSEFVLSSVIRQEVNYEEYPNANTFVTLFCVKMFS